MNKMILIDNGHGKETPGKCSPDKQLLEWSWTREVAAMVVNDLCAIGYDARLLTPEDNDVKLYERVRRVNEICSQRGAANVLVVSIHVNAAGGDGKWHDARGFMPYVSPNAGAGSRTLARMLYERMEAFGLIGNRWVSKDKYAVKSLAICRDTKCTAVLTENLFMDNIEDCEYLLSDEGKRTIANAHVLTICEFVG